MSELYFVNIDVSLDRPLRTVNPGGKRRQEKLRRFTVSLPIRDKTRAEELLDHFAKGLAEIFKEVEHHDQAQREAARAAGRDAGGAVRAGNDLKIVVDASGQVSGPGSDSGGSVDSDLRAMPDSPGEPEGEREST